MLTDRLTGDLLRAMERGEVRSEQLTAACLQVIHEHDRRIGAFLLLDEVGALVQARAIDARRARGEPLGSLAGLPVALKDVLCTRGLRTTCGSKILNNFIPPYDAHVVECLRRADAVL